MAFVACKVPMENVQDTASLEAAMRENRFGADDIVAVVAKTEGNGGVNDISRILVDRVLRDFLVEKGSRSRAEVMRVPIALSGGCDGVISPHLNIFASVPDSSVSAASKQELRLTVGVTVSEPILPEEIGRIEMVEKVAAGVRRAMADADITDPADVHFVQTKTPLLTAERIAAAKARGKTCVMHDTMESMAVSTATAALGIGVGVGEFRMPKPEQIARDLSLYSPVASCSSGVEHDEAQIVLVGNRRGIGGDFRIGHSVMKDALDVDGIMTGVATNVCVETTARQAFLRDYYVVFTRDCTATFTRAEHEAALHNIDQFFGQVASAEEVMTCWPAAAPAKLRIAP